MKIYMHCLTNQDITKQFAYTDDIRRNFFDDAKDQEEISLVGMKSERGEKVRILTATDCRFNANFRYILFAEGSATIGDIVIFYKVGYRKYEFELILKSDPRYEAYKQLFTDPRHLPIITNFEQLQNDSSTQEERVKEQKYSQIIYYGVPGCGKSNKIDEKTKNVPDEQKMRVVFHPEYTNADFVGQILPVQTADGIEYCFKAGPFARILKRALKNPEKPCYLIIEEINRGNAAAIFGDLFQLLDRKNDGWSSYSVENLDLNSFIRSQNDKYSDKDAESSVLIGNIAFTENTPIRLPPNLSIYATMNTSDQNVFILDNAFQRRWDMELVKNEFGDDSENQKQAIIEDSKITWKTFQKKINEKISQFSKENNFSSMIDKRLGCWFAKAVPDKNDANGKYVITKDSFKNKILKYLWDDAFKFNREEVFEAADNFETLLEKVKMDGSNFGIFKNIDFPAEEKVPEVEN